MDPFTISLILTALGAGTDYYNQREAQKNQRVAIEEARKRQQRIAEARNNSVKGSLEDLRPENRKKLQDQQVATSTQNLNQALQDFNTANPGGTGVAGKTSAAFDAGQAESVSREAKRASQRASVLARLRGPQDELRQQGRNRDLNAQNENTLSGIGQTMGSYDENRINKAGQTDNGLDLLSGVLSGAGALYGLGAGAGAGAESTPNISWITSTGPRKLATKSLPSSAGTNFFGDLLDEASKAATSIGSLFGKTNTWADAKGPRKL